MSLISSDLQTWFSYRKYIQGYVWIRHTSTQGRKKVITPGLEVMLILYLMIPQNQVKHEHGHGESRENSGNFQVISKLVKVHILSLICYDKLQTKNQTCPDFELRWCCAKNYLNSTKRIREKFSSYSDDYLDDLPKNNQSIRFEAFDKYN